MKRLFVMLFMLSSFLITSSNVFGQTSSAEPNIDIIASPNDPEPGEEITISLSSYEIDLGLAYIKWAGENNTKEGYGETEFVVNAPNNDNDSYTARAFIKTSEGQNIEKSITVYTNTYDLIWEAVDTKYPPFYAGKKLPIKENTLRVSLLRPTTSKQYSFKWQRNGKSITGKGGMNNPYVEFDNTEIQNKENVSVKVSNGGNIAERNIDIPLTKQRVLFYEYIPQFGLNTNNALNKSSIGYDGTVSVLGLPLGLSNNAKTEFNWNLSGDDVNSQENPFLLSFGKPEGKGVVKITVTIENLKSLYQEFKGVLNLEF